MKLFTNGELIENEDKIKDFFTENIKEDCCNGQCKNNSDKCKCKENKNIESQNSIHIHNIFSIKDY